MPGAPPVRSPLFDVEVSGPQRRQRTRFDRAEITIGRTATDIILPSAGIARRHARLFVRGGEAFVEDLASAGGTLVNGARIASPVPVAPLDRIEIGPYTLGVEPVLPLVRDPDSLDPTEGRLLAAIAGRDDAARWIYADWLEQRGDLARAEFLRVQQALVAMSVDDPAFAETSSRLRKLAAASDLHWRTLVARPAVEGCSIGFDFPCPREWGALDATNAASVRSCRSCHSHVFYCTDLETAREHGRRGHCVAIDPIAIRPARDPQPAPAQDACRRCGADGADREACTACRGSRGTIMMGLVIALPARRRKE